MSSFDVLGFMGRSQSGKDLSGKYLANKYDFVPVALADVLKRFTKLVFPFDSETHLWGESQYRNVPVPVDWVKARSNLVGHMDGWVATLALTVPEKAAYKNVLRRWFDACEERCKGQNLSARIALQLLGTEYGRGFKDSIWVDYFYQKVARPIERGAVYHPWYGVTGGEGSFGVKGIVITDLRFINELEHVQNGGGHVIRLIRLSQEGKETKTDKEGIPQHQSEMELQEIPLDRFDVVLRMEEGEDKAKARLDQMMEAREWENSSTHAPTPS